MLQKIRRAYWRWRLNSAAADFYVSLRLVPEPERLQPAIDRMNYYGDRLYST